MSDTAHYSMLIQWSDEDQAYLVTLPEWAEHVLGPVSHGDTYEEAVRRGQQALDALVASARKHGEPLPQPRTIAGVWIVQAVAPLASWHIGPDLFP